MSLDCTFVITLLVFSNVSLSTKHMYNKNNKLYIYLFIYLFEYDTFLDI